MMLMQEQQSATGKFVSIDEEARTYNPIEFDPEQTSGDDDDGDLLALRDAMRDIESVEGRFELLL